MTTGDTPARGRHRALAPCPDLWAALDHGPRLRAILETFYAEVVVDPELGPFFHATTLAWAIDHQYAFLAEIFGGQPGYFGDRPRNAHHAMVISDALFDRREAILEKHLRAHGLADEHVRRWREVDEAFRSHIVKSAPRPRMRGGVPQPLDGHERVTLSAGGWCDECSAVLDQGTIAAFHVRTGKVSCADCADARGIRID